MDFTNGYSRRDLIRFLTPLLAAELFQQFYALINTIVVNQVLDYRAVAIIGACSGFVAIRSNLISGMMFGFGICLGKAVGRKDSLFLHRTFSGAFWYALGIGGVGITVLPFIGVMLRAGNIPQELQAAAAWYLAVSFGGCFCIALKMLLLVLLQAIGETKFFSFLAAAGVIINMVLVLLFVGVLHGGVAFSALATVLTNLLLAVCLFTHIRKTYPEILTLISPRSIPGRIWLELIENGAVKTTYFVAGTLGKFILQSTINTFSVEVIAGQSWAVCIQTILFAPLGELGTASGVITGQNVGANNMENIRRYHQKLCRAMRLIGAAEIALVYLAGFPLLRLLSGADKPLAVAEAANLWIHVTVLAMPFCFTILYRNALQALGCYLQVVAVGVVEAVGICLTAILLVPVYGYPAAAAGMAASWLVQTTIGCGFFRNAMKGETRYE